MLIVSVHLHNGDTGRVNEIARMQIINEGTGIESLVDYRCCTFTGRDCASLDRKIEGRKGRVLNYARKNLHVWNLVARSLERMGYGWPGIDA